MMTGRMNKYIYKKKTKERKNLYAYIHIYDEYMYQKWKRLRKFIWFSLFSHSHFHSYSSQSYIIHDIVYEFLCYSYIYFQCYLLRYQTSESFYTYTLNYTKFHLSTAKPKYQSNNANSFVVSITVAPYTDYYQHTTVLLQAILQNISLEGIVEKKKKVHSIQCKRVLEIL